MNLIVDDSHFAYLKLQKGSLDHLKDDRAAWHAAYEQAQGDDYDSLVPYLPPVLAGRHVLDVGSGLGGIDVLLDRHYGGIDVHLLDGVDDPPEMTLHRRTFNSMKVAGDFLTRNGVHQWSYVALPPVAARPMDIVISLGSWCFHYGPSEYLAFVYRCCTSRTVLILDVRADRPEWRVELQSRFYEVGCAKASRKFNRLVFHAK
ncbi:hypothetical protein [Bradyrhizobium sp. JYMT SZCCT0428]|uniref:hypothetical protein n=1 Tax=Bradyrhizobium sp. JYMT SZCCT0428 TaxID=2807673 RepID=UPI001BA86993|nr:hypothetical protein [Bradyrhizobium sp. JYMT SZCCT0428]MBR1150091.1 hypothetical protein [Bradyrhizobium sp. JYMT SZCCT0428]